MIDRHTCEDKDALVSYLYGEADADDRRRIDAHLAACVTCAQEVEELRGVREQLTAWRPPERELGFAVVPVRGRSRLRALWPVPVWAQLAAAMLVVAVAAAIANVRVRYDADGFEVRTGWREAPREAAAPRPGGLVPAAVQPLMARPAQSAAAEPAWRGELSALARELRAEVAQASARTRDRRGDDASAAPADQQELLRRVQALIAESERRQQQEFALRLTQLTHELDAQRRNDLLRIDRAFGHIDSRTGAEVAQQRQMLEQLFLRVSTQPRQ